MTIPDGQAKLRILLVDNDVRLRQEFEQLLKGWHYEVFASVGTGQELEDDAVSKVRAHRCHLALVDVRLRDDFDSSDQSGLALISRLLPTLSITITSFPNWRT